MVILFTLGDDNLCFLASLPPLLVLLVVRVLSFLIPVFSSLVHSVVETGKQTDLDMKKGPWQSRVRACRQVTSPEGKEVRVRKPYKKPRQVTVKETEEADSQAPTQLGHGETVDNSAMVDISEFYVETDTMLDEPKAIPSPNKALQKSPASLKTVSGSSASSFAS